jgi:DNA topoisomerase IA
MAPKGQSVAATQYASRLRNVRGTFAAEGMTVSRSTEKQLERIAKGQSSYHQVLHELRAKYEKRG